MKILIIGWFGAGNIGDEAILLAELHAMRERISDAEFHILSFDPERTQRLVSGLQQVVKIIGVGSKHKFLRTDFRGLWHSLTTVDMVVIGGGGIFQDIYNHYPIPFFTFMVVLAKLLSKRVVIHSVGVGPIRTWIGKRLTRAAANLADSVTVRDHESQYILASIGVNKDIGVSADPVFLLEPVKSEKVKGLLASNDLTSGLKIGVCIQDLLSWSNENKMALAEALDRTISEMGAKVVFIPFGSYRDGWFSKDSSDTVDLSSARRLAAMMNERAIIIAEELDPQELLSFIGELDIIISMRLHGIIMGISQSIPVIGLTYKQETKITNLMKWIGQGENLFFVDELNRENILNHIEAILSHKEHLKLSLRKKKSVLAKRAEIAIESLLKVATGDGVLYKAAVS